MPIEVKIWRVGENLQQIDSSKINSEQKLEDFLAEDISILDDNFLLIGRQVPTAYGKFIDLLAIDREGKLVVIELKRARTPREVVAQALDYGSWVKELEDEDIANLYEYFANKYQNGSDISLDQAFCEKFKVNEMPEIINETHELIVVAAELDNSTERIINYLTDFGVAINAVFFRFFKDGDHEYLSRAWLIEPEKADEKITKKRGKLPWNGEYYVSFGHREDGRHWEDARKYGFISAGGGEWYSRTLNLLENEGRIWVNVPQKGYVGVGIVKGGPVLPKDFFVTNENGKEISISQAQLQGNLTNSSDNSEGKEEYLIHVEWLKTVPLEQAKKEKGFFGNQNSVAKPRSKKWIYTVDRLSKKFDIKI